jgi:hypothetical protein
MELKNNHFSMSMNELCKDIITQPMIEMIGELSAHAMFVMNTDLEASVTARTTGTIVDILKTQKYKFMPFYLVCEGFTRGSMGELGGTTRFTVRNVCTWMNAMYEKLAQINTEKKTKEDSERRASETRAFKQNQKRGTFYGAAMYRKMEWAQAGAITSADYDRLTLDKIVAKIKEGYSIKELQPSMIL